MRQSRRKILRKTLQGLTLALFIIIVSTNPMECPQILQTEKGSLSPTQSATPVGMIGIWTGTIASIPAGWSLCDGSGGTPDLRDRFILSVGTSEDPGAVGGSANHTHTYSQLPSHSHGISVPSHQHSVPGVVGSGGSFSGLLTTTTTRTNYATQSEASHTHSAGYTGEATCNTKNATSMPPYFEVAFIMKTVSSAPLPTGIVLIWTGLLGNIPQGWILCDGASGSPNFMDDFLLSVGASENPNATGGSSSHSHTYTDLVNHTHTLTYANNPHNFFVNGSSSSTIVSVIDPTITGTQTTVNTGTASGSQSITSVLAGIGDTTSTTSALPPYFEVAFIQKTGSEDVVPKNAIVMWANTIASIPGGWDLCDGAGTPNLLDRFPRSVGTLEDPGATGDSSSHTHTYTQLRDHTHSVDSSGFSHVHAINVITGSGGISNMPVYTTTGLTQNNYISVLGSHSHGVDYAGLASCTTNSGSILPPYYKLAFIMHTNTAPVASYVTITPTPTAFTTEPLSVTYTYYDEEADLKQSPRIRWYKNEVLQPFLNDSATVPAMWTNKTDTWNCTIEPSDGKEYGAVNWSNTVRINNSLASVSGVSITPSSANTAQDLTVNILFTDADGDTNKSRIIWYMNGAPQTYLENSTTVAAGWTNKSQKWNCTVEPYDGEAYGTLVWSSNSVIIANSLPSISGATITPSSANTAQDLTVNVLFSDADGDTNKSRIIWYMDGAPQTYLENSTTVAAGWTNKSQKWNCTVEPYDGEAYGTLVWSTNSVIIGNSLPSISGATITPSSANTAQDLTVNVLFSDADGDTNKSRIIWYMDGAPQPYLENRSTVAACWTNDSQIWNCTLEPYDGEAYGALVWSSNSVLIGNALPSVSGVTITPSSGENDQDLIVHVTFTDADGDANQSRIIWYMNGAPQPYFENRTTVAACWTNKSQKWNCTVEPYDGKAYGTLVWSSNSVIIGNSLPSVSGVTITPSSGENDQDLIVHVTFTDADGDANQSRIIWYMNGAPQPYFENRSTVAACWTNKSQKWNCTVEPYDGVAYGTLVWSSNSVIIGNSLPSVSGVTITPSSANTVQDLTVNVMFIDPDNDANQSRIIWYMNGAPQPYFENRSTVAACWTNKSQKWNCTVEPYDGEVYGTLVWSDTCTILNAAPIYEDVSIPLVNPNTIDALAISLSGFSDADVDPAQQPRIRWYKNNVLQPSLNDTLTIPACWTNRTEYWNASIEAYDGASYGAMIWTNTIRIVNALPMVTGLSLSPTTPVPGSALLVLYTYSDIDNDALVLIEIIWYRNGIRQSIYDNLGVLPEGVSMAGDVWFATIRPFDGVSYGLEKTSPSVLIADTDISRWIFIAAIIGPAPSVVVIFSVSSGRVRKRNQKLMTWSAPIEKDESSGAISKVLEGSQKKEEPK